MNHDPHHDTGGNHAGTPAGNSTAADDRRAKIQPEYIIIPSARREPWWRRIGGGSLTISLIIHAAFIALAIFVLRFVVDTHRSEPETYPMPGGGGGGKSAEAKIAMQRRMNEVRAPLRVTHCGTNAEVLLPDVQGVSGFLTQASYSTMGGGGIGGGEGGVNGSGRGTLSGDGIGIGRGPGSAPGIVSMFGKPLQARRLAVVLDVSGSMHRWLPTVVAEANKISGGCPIVLFYGCGIKEPTDGAPQRQTPEAARGRDFEEFWRRTFNRDGAPPSSNPGDPLPSEAVFRVFDDRKDTFYFERMGVAWSWLALTSQKVREADAIYWFADFQDPVDEAQLLEVQKLLLRRKQKLYVHASGSSQPSLDAVTRMLVQPTGGEVLKVELRPAQ